MSWLVICCSILDAIFITTEMGLYCVSPSLELWNNLEAQEQYPTDKTNTDEKQKNVVPPIREKALTLWITYFMLENEAISSTFLGLPITKSTAHYKINEPKQQGLSLSTGYFPWIIFVLMENQLSVREALVKRRRQTVIKKF